MKTTWIKQINGSTRQEENSLQPEIVPSPKPASRNIAVNGAVWSAVWVLPVLLFGCVLTHCSMIVSPCIPEEAKSDSGAALAFGTINFLIWLLTTPLAVLLGGLVGYAVHRYYGTRKLEPLGLVASVLSGGFSSLVFIVINGTIFHYLICTGLDF